MVSKSGISHDIFDGGDGRFPESKWSVMASKLVRYGLKTGLIWLSVTHYDSYYSVMTQYDSYDSVSYDSLWLICMIRCESLTRHDSVWLIGLTVTHLHDSVWVSGSPWLSVTHYDSLTLILLSMTHNDSMYHMTQWFICTL